METRAAGLNRPSEAHFLHSNVPVSNIEKEGGMALERGVGVYVFDTDGKRYLEAISGAWHIAFGFSEQRLLDAVTEQMAKFPAYHAFWGRVAEPTLRLADRLAEIAPMPTGKVFFSNSGSESNESAIKMIWLINWAKGRPEKRKIFSRKNAYHGSTALASSLSGRDYIHPFGLPVAEVRYADMPHHWRYGESGESEEDYASRLAQRLDDQIVAEDPQTVAAFIADPVMSAGGVVPPPLTYFEKVEAVCRKHDVAIISDEVVTGLGRTGELWGATTFGYTPDIVTTSKVLSAGYYPIGATLVSEGLSEELQSACRKTDEFSHGFTTGGSPAGAALGLRVIELLLEDGVLDHLGAITPRFSEGVARLASNPFVGEVRQVGLMAGLELVADKTTNLAFASERQAAEQIVRIGLENGLILRPLGDSVVLAPPFVTSEAELDKLFEGLDGVMESFGALAAGWVVNE